MGQVTSIHAWIGKGSKDDVYNIHKDRDRLDCNALELTSLFKSSSRAPAMAERSRVPVSRLFNNARGFEPHLGRKFEKK